jgi:hypothetical protein
MKTTARLTAFSSICFLGQVGLSGAQSQAALPYTEIYQRATNEFAEAVFFKPREPRTPDLSFSLAPLILQEVHATKQPLSLPDRFGTLCVSNRAPVLDPSHPAIYWQTDAVQIKEKAFTRLAYLWCYGASPLEPALGPSTSGTATGQVERALPLQGIRITLNSAGQPGIWEVLADSSGAKLFFASQNLEAAALAEFGQPLPGRRFAVERSMEAAPDVIVARVIDDSPVAAGPIVYLGSGTRSVSTLICRCMPAQANKLVATSTYELLPFNVAATNSLIVQARTALHGRAAFWPGDDPDGEHLEACLRLPAAFFSSRK